MHEDARKGDALFALDAYIFRWDICFFWKIHTFSALRSLSFSTSCYLKASATLFQILRSSNTSHRINLKLFERLYLIIIKHAKCLSLQL